MRINAFKSVKFLSVIVALVCAVFLAFNFVPSGVFAAGNEVKVGIVVGSDVKTDSYPIPFPTVANPAPQILCIEGYSGSGSEKVVYSILKEDSHSYVFSQLPDAVEITAENPTAQTEYNFFVNGGVGTYRIKAVILDANDNILNSDIREFRLTVSKPIAASLNGEINIKQVGTSRSDFPEFYCSVDIKNGSHSIPLDNYEIDWFYNCNGQEKIYCGSGASLAWAPDGAGVYKLFVEIDDLNIYKECDVGELSKNYSLYAIIAFSALGFVLLVIVIITTIRKVRKERVW